MAIEVTVRHTVLPDEAKEHAQERAVAIEDRYPGVEHIHVILDKQRHQYIAEAVIQGKNHLRFEASVPADTIRRAIDLAFEKVETQLHKAREKIQDHRPHGAPREESPDESGSDEQE